MTQGAPTLDYTAHVVGGYYSIASEDQFDGSMFFRPHSLHDLNKPKNTSFPVYCMPNITFLQILGPDLWGFQPIFFLRSRLAPDLAQRARHQSGAGPGPERDRRWPSLAV